MELNEADKRALLGVSYQGVSGKALIREVESGRFTMLKTGRQSFVIKLTSEVPPEVLAQQEQMRKNGR